MIICDIFEAFIIEAIKYSLVVVWRVNDLQTDDWLLAGVARIMSEFLTNLDTRPRRLHRLVDAPLSCCCILVVNELRCIGRSLDCL